MADVDVTRELKGEPVVFVGLAPGGIVIADLKGNEMLTTRATWLSLPLWGAHKRGRRRPGVSADALLIAALFVLFVVCGAAESIGTRLAAMWKRGGSVRA